MAEKEANEIDKSISMVNNREKEELHQSFLETSFTVETPKGTQFISLISNNDWVSQDTMKWCFISAYNPLCELLSDLENEDRNEKLKEYLDGQKIEYFMGSGISKDKKWTEVGFFILNIDKDAAKLIGREQAQVAIIVGESNSKGSLEYMDD